MAEELKGMEGEEGKKASELQVSTHMEAGEVAREGRTISDRRLVIHDRGEGAKEESEGVMRRSSCSERTTLRKVYLEDGLRWLGVTQPTVSQLKFCSPICLVYGGMVQQGTLEVTSICLSFHLISR
jgi:hypothetical protein